MTEESDDAGVEDAVEDVAGSPSITRGASVWWVLLGGYLLGLIAAKIFFDAGLAKTLLVNWLGEEQQKTLPWQLASGGFDLWLVSFPIAFLAAATLLRFGSGGNRAGLLMSVFGGSLVGAIAALILCGQIWVPNILVLALIVAFVLGGSWLGATFAASKSTIKWGIGQAGLMFVLLLLILFVAGGLAVTWGEAPVEKPPLTTKERRRIAKILKDHDPRKLPEGQTGELDLSETDANQIVNWALAVLPGRHAAEVTMQKDRASLSASFQPPPLDRLNGSLGLAVGGSLAAEGGRLEFKPDQVQVGSLSIPRSLLALAGPFRLADLPRGLQANPMFGAVDQLQMDDQSLRVSYHRIDVKRGLVRDLLVELGVLDDLEAATGDYIQALIDESDRSTTGVDGADLIQAAFREAGRRTELGGDPRRENGYAILALGYLTGHRSVKVFLGPGIPQPSPQGWRAFDRVTLNGRRDLFRHFILSATMTVLSNDVTSMDVGLLKEELDAQGGSGFSFPDLLADRSGVRFATEATRSATAARRVQTKLSEPVQMLEIAPGYEGLPEGIQDQRLVEEFGGVGGKRYEELIREIDRRIDDCSLYR